MPGSSHRAQAHEHWISGRSIRQGLLEVGFLNLPVRETDLRLETLKKGPLWIAVPKAHPVSRYDRVPLGALKDEGFVGLKRRYWFFSTNRISSASALARTI
jgi:hypothetical protein